MWLSHDYSFKSHHTVSEDYCTNAEDLYMVADSSKSADMSQMQDLSGSGDSSQGNDSEDAMLTSDIDPLDISLPNLIDMNAADMTPPCESVSQSVCGEDRPWCIRSGLSVFSPNLFYMWSLNVKP